MSKSIYGRNGIHRGGQTRSIALPMERILRNVTADCLQECQDKADWGARLWGGGVREGYLHSSSQGTFVQRDERLVAWRQSLV